MDLDLYHESLAFSASFFHFLAAGGRDDPQEAYEQTGAPPSHSFNTSTPSKPRSATSVRPPGPALYAGKPGCAAARRWRASALRAELRNQAHGADRLGGRLPFGRGLLAPTRTQARRGPASTRETQASAQALGRRVHVRWTLFAAMQSHGLAPHVKQTASF